jgi:hydroxymethylpyrimidine pyrophosphatase-like HAD family hydrolase
MKAKDNSRIRLIAVDLDGTLLTSQPVMAPESTRLLMEAARSGVHVVLVTGRVIDSVRTLCSSLEITDPVISPMAHKSTNL